MPKKEPMPVCRIVQRYDEVRFGWVGHPPTQCIMAIKTGKEIPSLVDLSRVMKEYSVTTDEGYSITNLDAMDGSKEDVEVIKELGKRLGVKIVLG